MTGSVAWCLHPLRPLWQNTGHWVANEQQMFVSQSSEGWTLQDQEASRFEVQWGPASWFTDGWLLHPCSPVMEGARKLYGDPFMRELIPFIRLCPHDLATCQRSHLRVLSHWGNRFEHIHFKGHKYSVYGSWSSRNCWSVPNIHFPFLLGYRQGCPIFWRLWATLEEEELSWDTH